MTAVHRWARRRQGTDRAPVRFDRRRIYILPTRFGVLYGLAVFTMLLGSMNYNNGFALALTFLLAGVGLVAMHHTHRNLNGVVVTGVQVGEAFAGGRVVLTVGCENPSATARHDLRFASGDHEAELRAFEAGAMARVAVELAAGRRGILRPERLRVSTTYPLGLFRAWSWLHLPIEAVVYPRLSGNQVPPPSAIAERGSLEPLRRGEEDFRGFRSYHPGDSPRHIAWKALARGAPVLVKDYAGANRTPLVFTLEQVQARDLEARLSQLASWIVNADRHSNPFGLALPAVE